MLCRHRVVRSALMACCVLAGAGAGPGPALAESIWVEGEAAADASGMTRHPWWYDQVKAGELSAGGWLSHFDAAKPGEAAYRVRAPEAGEYRLYVRLNPVKSRTSVRVNDGEWRVLDASSATDQVNVAADEAPDLRFVGWVDAGPVALGAGANTVRFRFEKDGSNEHHGALDAFVFADEPFTPSGKLKPGQSAPAVVAAGTDETWAFAPGRDPFRGDALVDLSFLNEDVAGATGFVRVGEDGDFVRGDGEPLRFWALNTYVWRDGMEALKEHARFLAKKGVNNVRYHGNLRDASGDIGSIDAEAREQLWQLVAAMKDEGIYVTFSPYYAHATPAKETRGAWGLPRDPAATNTGSLLFFDERLQEAYKGWLKQTLEPVNPHTGVALKDEPALAIIQIQNEDSLLFWTLGSLGGEDREALRRRFGAWLGEKYGGLEAARSAWEGAEAQGAKSPDDWASGSIEISNPWAWFQPELNAGGLGKRMTDEVEFLVTLMRDWNAEVARFLREEVGAKQVVNAGNWKTADPLRLNDLERYSYTTSEVLGVNRYTGALHRGDASGWAVTKGDVYTDKSVTLHPEDLPVALKQAPGKAMILPEALWVPPNLYQSEGPFLVAAYQSLNGVDAVYWFATGETQWREPSSANGYLPSVGKWVLATPEILGNFPAAALMYRLGYVERGEPVVVEHRSLRDLWERRAPIIAEEGTFDPNRDARDITEASPVKTEVDRLAFLVGPVHAVYDSDPGETRVADLGRYIKRDEATVVSNTGQLSWDFGDGLVTLDAPKAQGVTGFLEREGSFALSDVTIESRDAYATIVAVAMDDRPLASSGKVLVQVGTTARPTGWATREVTAEVEGREVPAREVVEFGRAPWQVAKTRASVAVRNPSLSRATLVDPNGYAVRELEVSRAGGAVRVELPEDAKYVVLE